MRLESNEVAAIEARLTKLAARPPVVKEAEASFWRAFRRRLFDRGANDYFYWSVLLQLRSTFHKPDIAAQRWSLESAAYFFRHATYCVDFHAARYLSGLIRIEDFRDGAPSTAEAAIGQLRRRTGALTLEVAAIKRQIGRPIFLNDAAFEEATNLAANAYLFRRAHALRTRDAVDPH